MTGGNDTNESILSCDVEIIDAGIRNHIQLDNKAKMPPVYVTSPTNKSVTINEESLKHSDNLASSKEVINEDDAKLNNYFEFANKSKTPKSSMETPTTDDWYVLTKVEFFSDLLLNNDFNFQAYSCQHLNFFKSFFLIVFSIKLS